MATVSQCFSSRSESSFYKLRKPLKVLYEELSVVLSKEKLETHVSPEQEAIYHGHSSSFPLAAVEGSPYRWEHVRAKLKEEILVTLGNAQCFAN